MIPKRLTTAQLERVYDLIAETVDSVPREKRELLLAKLALALANLVGDPDEVEAVAKAAARDL